MWLRFMRAGEQAKKGIYDELEVEVEVDVDWCGGCRVSYYLSLSVTGGVY